MPMKSKRRVHDYLLVHSHRSLVCLLDSLAPLTHSLACFARTAHSFTWSLCSHRSLIRLIASLAQLPHLLDCFDRALSFAYSIAHSLTPPSSRERSLSSSSSWFISFSLPLEQDFPRINGRWTKNTIDYECVSGWIIRSLACSLTRSRTHGKDIFERVNFIQFQPIVHRLKKTVKNIRF